MARRYEADLIRVLIIEDDARDRALAARLVNGCPQDQFSTVVADSLAAGLSCLSEMMIDVVLLDMGLPDSSLNKSISEIKKTRNHPPVVVFTGTDADSIFSFAIRLGADDLIVKGSPQQRICRALQAAVIQARYAAEFRDGLSQLRENIDKLTRLRERVED